LHTCSPALAELVAITASSAMEPAMDVFMPLNAAVLLSSFLGDGLVAWIGVAEEAVILEIIDRGQ
jgi:hypothetical protein